MNMQIWAGSGSSFNGRETVRRRSMTPKKTSKSLRKRKSSARIGLGVDGSCSIEDVEESSPCQSLSPRRDSGIDREMAYEGLIHDVESYGGEEDMVKPLNFGSRFSDSENADAIDSMKKGLKKEKQHKVKMDNDQSDSFENLSTPKKSKGEDVNTVQIRDDLKKSQEDVLKEIQRLEGDFKKSQTRWSDEDSYGVIIGVLPITKNSNGEDSALVDFDIAERVDLKLSPSLVTLGRKMASEDFDFRIDQERDLRVLEEKEQKQVESSENDSDSDSDSHGDGDGGVFLSKSSVDTRRMSPKGLPPLKTTGLTQNDRQYLASIDCEDELEKLFDGEGVSEIESPNGPSSVEHTKESSQTIHIAGYGDESSSESKHEPERIFSANHEQIPEPADTPYNDLGDGCLEDIQVVLDTSSGDASRSESEQEIENISRVQEQFLELKSQDRDHGGEYVTFGTKSVPESQNALDEETCLTAIRSFSMKVPNLVREAGESLDIPPLHSRRHNGPSLNVDIMGEVTSLKETEFCASGLKHHASDEFERSLTMDSLEASYGGWPCMKDEPAVASLEEISSNCENEIPSLVLRKRAHPVIDSSDHFSCCSNVGIVESAQAEGEFDEDFPSIQVEAISSSEDRRSQPGQELSNVENYEALLYWNESANSDELENEHEIRNSEGFSPVKTPQDHTRSIRKMDLPNPVGRSNIFSPKEDFDLAVCENEREIATSEGFSPIHQKVISSLTPKHSVRFVVKEKKSKPPPGYHARIFRSLRADYVETFGDERKEGLIRGGYSEGGAEMLYIQPEEFWMQTSSRKQASGTESEVEDEIVIDEEERQYRLEIGRRMKRKNPGLLGPTIDEFGGVFMGISQARVDDGRGTTRRSIPQMDGPGSPKLLAVDAPVERSWSPSPRKKLQKVNRSKSPNSMKKSSSSSLGRVFQKSKVEGLEGEVRDLRTEVGGLKRLVESLEKELRRVEFQGAKGCEIVGNMREKTKEMWRTVYGKGWDGEKVGEEGQDWKDLEEVEYTKKVRDLGLLRVMGRLEMKVDKQREEMHQVEDGVFRRERGIETYDMDLMLPHPIQPGFKGGDTGRNYGKIEGRRFMSTDTSNSSERSESRESAVGGGRKRNNSIIERHLDSMALVFSESLKHEGQLLKLKGGGLDLEREDKMLGDDGYQSGCRFGDMVKGTEALDMELDREDDAKKAKEELFPPQDVIRDFAELPYFGMEGIESSASRMQLWGMIKRNRIKRGIEEMGLVDGSRKVGPVLGGLVEEEEDGEGEFDESELRLLGGVFDDDEDGLGVELGSAVGELLEKKSDGVIGSWKPDVDEMTELIEAEGIYSPALLLGGGGEKNKEKEKEKERRLKDFIRSVLEEQEVERARREEWWEIERTRDLDEVRRLGGELSELKGLILRGLGDSRGICGGGGIGGAVCGGGGNAGGGPGGRASNVANMRERDVCGDGDGDEDCGGSGSGSGNGKGFWDWVGGGILWRQD